MTNNKEIIVIYSGVVLLVILLIFVILGENGLVKYYRLNREKQNLADQIAEVQFVNRSLSRKINRLKTDNVYIETLARQELGLVDNDEIIIKLPGVK